MTNRKKEKRRKKRKEIKTKKRTERTRRKKLVANSFCKNCQSKIRITRNVGFGTEEKRHCKCKTQWEKSNGWGS